ncbi:MAG TPA: Hsp20 family protein [Nitrospiraceae bacterium]|nr:Hsp20 family protein [Nitrospiraceae bacterium]
MLQRLSTYLGRPAVRTEAGKEARTVADWSPRVDSTEDDQAYLIKADLPDMKKEDVTLTAQDKVMSISGERKYGKVEIRDTMMQTTRAAFSVLMGEPFIAPTLLPVCCDCRLIRDDTRFSPGRELWVTQRTYHKTHAVNPSALALTHTYCPTCFTQVQGTARQDFREIGSAP